MSDQRDSVQARRAEAMRKYRQKYPQRRYIQRLREARALLRKAGFTVTGGNVNLSDLHSLDTLSATAGSDQQGGDGRDL